jgi:UDP-3-O-[3-hydroxymyristoyl] glucosamine N-acyltransferase
MFAVQAARIDLSQIVSALGGELCLGEGASDSLPILIERIGPLDGATPNTLAFLANPRYLPQLAASKAACVIVAPHLREAALARGPALLTPDPYLYFARATQWWAARTRPQAVLGIHSSACVAPSAKVAASASIGPFVVIEDGAHIGAGVVIGAHTVIGMGASIGANTRLATHVHIGFACRVGARCIVHAGVVMGADGFGFAPTAMGSDQNRWEKIEQLGAVWIGDDVEIGANTCIDRGALDDTVIEDGVKLDNLIQIGHNVHIGAHSALAGCVGVAGSARIGAHCTVGGAAVVLGHLELADHVHISAASVVTRSLRQAGRYSGVFPLDEHASWEKNAASLRQLHQLRQRLRVLEAQNKLPNTSDRAQANR